MGAASLLYLGDTIQPRNPGPLAPITLPLPHPTPPRTQSRDVGAASTGAVEKGRVFINVFQNQDW